MASAAFEPKSAVSATAVPPPTGGVVAPSGGVAAPVVAPSVTPVVAPAVTPAASVTVTAPAVSQPSASPAVLGPASDSKPSNSAGLITKQGRWKPPAEDAPSQAAGTDHISLASAAAVVVAASPAVAPAHHAEVKHADSKPVEKTVEKAPEVVEKAPETKPVETKPAETKPAEPVRSEEVKVAEPKTVEQPGKSDDKASEQAKEEWEYVNAADLSREVEQRVAASQLVVEEKEPVAAPLPKKIEAIRYDEVSYNPLEEKEGKKKYSKEVRRGRGGKKEGN